MGKYIYVVKNSTGQTISDVCEASDQETLVEQLQKQGYFVISLKPQADIPLVVKPRQETQRTSLGLER